MGEAYNIPNKRIPRCDTWIKYRPRYNISIMMIEGQRARGVARCGEVWRGRATWEMREKRGNGEQERRGLESRTGLSRWESVERTGRHMVHVGLSVHPFPHPPTSPATCPHPFTDYTSITPDNTWLPLNVMYRMTERCFAFFSTFRYECSGLVMKKRGERMRGEEERRGQARVVKTG